MRDEELSSRKVELSQPSDDVFKILHHLNAYWKPVYIYAKSIHYAVDFLNSGRRKGVRKFGQANQISKHSFATYSHLLDQASCRPSD